MLFWLSWQCAAVVRFRKWSLSKAPWYVADLGSWRLRKNMVPLNLTRVEHDSISHDCRITVRWVGAYCRHCCPASQACITLDFQLCLNFPHFLCACSPTVFSFSHSQTHVWYIPYRRRWPSRSIAHPRCPALILTGPPLEDQVPGQRIRPLGADPQVPSEDSG